MCRSTRNAWSVYSVAAARLLETGVRPLLAVNATEPETVVDELSALLHGIAALYLDRFAPFDLTKVANAGGHTDQWCSYRAIRASDIGIKRSDAGDDIHDNPSNRAEFWWPTLSPRATEIQSGCAPLEEFTPFVD